ncbi:MAG: type I-A CRISPR-associated protein Cas7/Csa2 [Desulfurococcaceae archaeon]
MFLSIGARLEVNVEALNAVETVGNLAKHRRAPMVIPTSNGYRLVYTPTVSGESIANAYQRHLVELARCIYADEKKKPPLTLWDERHEFSKFMDNKHLTEKLLKLLEESSKRTEKKGGEKKEIVDIKHEFEKRAIEESLVADIGGFLYAEERLPVKRTSRFYCGYLLPTYDTLEATAMEAQFHARHMPAESGRLVEEESKKTETEESVREEGRRAQMIYYVEIASAVYGLTMALDIGGIGRTTLVRVEDAVDLDERKRRIKIAIGAMASLFSGNGFGARLARFTPVKRVISAIAVLSDVTPFMVTPPQQQDYMEDTVRRASTYCSVLSALDLNPNIKIASYGKQVDKQGCVEVINVGTIEELFLKILEMLDRDLGRQG